MQRSHSTSFKVSSKFTVPVNEGSDSHFPPHHSGRPSPEHQRTLLLSEHCGGPPDERGGGEGEGREREGEGREEEREREGKGRGKGGGRGRGGGRKRRKAERRRGVKGGTRERKGR